MNIINLQTGEPFDSAPRMHHREPSLEGASSVSSRSRNLLGLRGAMMGKTGTAKTPYVETRGESTSFWAESVSNFGLDLANAVQSVEISGEMMLPSQTLDATDSNIGMFCTAYSIFLPLSLFITKGDTIPYLYGYGTPNNSNGARLEIEFDTKFEFETARIYTTSDYTVYVRVGEETKSKTTSSTSGGYKMPADRDVVFGGSKNAKGVTEVSTPVKIRFYSLKIKQNGTTYADMVACKNGDEIGMYDSVGERFIAGHDLIYGEE